MSLRATVLSALAVLAATTPAAGDDAPGPGPAAVAIPPAGQLVPPPRPGATLLAQLRRSEPDLAEVRDAAVRAAGLTGTAEREFARRARLAGALPTLTVRAAHSAGSDRDRSQLSTGSERLAVGIDRTIDIEIRAVWELDRLIFDDVELRAIRARRRAHRERARLLAEVGAAYYRRRKLQLAPVPADPHKALLHALAVAEADAQLDALTDGWFTRELSRRQPRRTRPETSP